jgi:hypothetical protein
MVHFCTRLNLRIRRAISTIATKAWAIPVNLRNMFLILICSGVVLLVLAIFVSSLWVWLVLEGLGVISILVGVVVEEIGEAAQSESTKARLKNIGARILVIGLAIDIPVVIKSGFEISDLYRQTSDAIASAGKANAATGETNEAAAELTQKNIGLQRQVEDEHKANLELWAKIQPRSIPQERREELLRSLKNISPKCKVVITSNLADPETYWCAKQIRDALNEAGFTAIEWTPVKGRNGETAPFIIFDRGIFILADDVTRPPIDAAAIADCFATVGMPMKLVTNNQNIIIDADTIFVWVGPKPQ